MGFTLRLRCQVLRVVATLLLGSALSCSTASPLEVNRGASQTTEQQDLPEIPLAALPAGLKESDFRITPPVVQRLEARRAKDGRTIIEVQFAPDSRLKGRSQLALLVNQALPNNAPQGTSSQSEVGQDARFKGALPEPLLRDDGQGGDRQAGDGIFSLLHPASFRSVLAEQNRMREAAFRKGFRTWPRFVDREIVAFDKFDLIKGDADRFPILHSLPFFVDAGRSLFVTDVGVVEDPTRTAHPCTGAGAGLGKWSFGHLMTGMAGTDDPATFTEAFFNLFNSDQTTANGLVAPARAAGVLASWPRLPSGKLDLARAPFKLLAIVNRIDLNGNFSYGRVGGAEARFIFQAMNVASPTCAPLAGNDSFLIIFEYGVPRKTCTSMRDWAQKWKALAGFVVGTPAYNAKLEALTEEFVAAGASPGKPRGSAINQVRTNQADGFVERWVLREFHLGDAGFAAAGVRQTPEVSFNGARFGGRAADLATWINARQADVLANRHTVTDFLDPATPTLPFLGAIAQNQPVHKLMPSPAEEPLFLCSLWRATGIATSQLRHAFSLQTCDGCHGRETDSTFVHVGNASFGVQMGHEAPLSGFLTGTTVTDPDDHTLHHAFNELQRRAEVLQDFAEADCFDRPFERFVDRPVDNTFGVSRLELQVPLPPLATQPLLATH